MGILEESKRSKTNGFGFWRSKKFIIIVASILLAGSAYAFWPENNDVSVETQTKEWTVKKDDIVISVEANGSVVAEDGVELSFGANDDNLEVKEVFVKEGDTIKQGDKIATVETDDLQLSLNSAWLTYQSSLADYNETLAGATADQIADAKDKISTAEISLEQARQSLEATRQSTEEQLYKAEKAVRDARQDLADNSDVNSSEDVRDAYEALVTELKSLNISLEGILKESDGIIGVDEAGLNDAFEDVLGAEKVSSYGDAKRSYLSAQSELKELDKLVLLLDKNSEFADIESAGQQAELALGEFEDHLYDMKIMLDATITFSGLSQAGLDAMISGNSTNRSSINSKITSLDSKVDAVDAARESLGDYEEAYEEALRDLENTKSDIERDIYNAKASVDSKEMSLEQARRDYDDLTAPLTGSEMASARSRLNSALVSYQKAQNSYDDATLLSPIDGQVVELNCKPGDIIVDNNEPAAVILNSETLFITVDAEEADVSKLSVGQKAIATFDALDELQLEGEISFISLISNTSNNGIVTYEVRVLINNPEEKSIREGMTAYVEFVASEARDVLTIPVAAVRNVEGKPSVQNTEGEWMPVTTGFTDGKYVEVISGLNAGDKIIY